MTQRRKGQKRKGPRKALTVRNTQDARAFEKPLVAALAMLTGAVSLDKRSGLQIVGRLAQGAVQQKFKEQLRVEFVDLCAKGKINNERMSSVDGFQSFADLLSSIEEDRLDQHTFDALKAAFYAMNAVSTQEKERAYYTHIFHLLRELSSVQICVLSASYDLYKKQKKFHNSNATVWLKTISNDLGYRSSELVAIAEEGLIQHRLLSPRRSDSNLISVANVRLTELALDLCNILETYTYEHLSAK